jgi:diguanylate cyclase (GGDEF)-like protein/PAS domain S-box-containing protein
MNGAKLLNPINYPADSESQESQVFHARTMHRLLQSQLQRLLGLEDAAQTQVAMAALAALAERVQADEPGTARLLSGIGALFAEVAATYESYDLRITLLQRSLDLSERLRAETQPRLWSKVFEVSREGIVITDREQRILSVNSAVTKITGYAAEEIIGQTPRLFASGKHDRNFYRAIWEAIAREGYWEGEIWDRRKNGEIYPKWLTIGAVRNSAHEVTHYIASFTDITQRKAHEERIQHLAYHDPLTGLPNRRLLCDRFAQEMTHARHTDSRIELLFLDLDHFKKINDTLGHPVGDKLLCAATARLKSCLRETDIISRQGGDEFVIVLSGRGLADNIPLIARKLLDRLNEPFEIDGHLLNASSSIGISIFPDDGDDFATLLQKADTALYQAKKDGRGTYRCFDPQMNAAALERSRRRPDPAALPSNGLG